jgi:hypothetical protein
MISSTLPRLRTIAAQQPLLYPDTPIEIVKLMNKNLVANQTLDMSIAGMLSPQELQYLYEYTKNEYSGRHLNQIIR